MTKTLVNIIESLRTGLGVLLTTGQPELKPTMMEIPSSKLYPSRITNGSVKRLLDSGDLKKLAERVYELKTGQIDAAYAEVRPGVLEVCFDYKTGKTVNPEVVEKRLLSIQKPSHLGTPAYA